VSAALDALLASVTPEFVVLAEVQPMEILGAWTAAGGGLSNTYYCSFASQIQTDVVGGGIYRRLDEVRQNGTALTSRASAALVNSNLGSYFHDTANGRIYVSTTTGAHPDTFALLGAWFTLFFSTRAVTFSDQPVYAPIISGQLPAIEASMPDQLFGATITYSGSLSLLNGDGLFDKLAGRFVWRNKRVTFKLGGIGLAYSDFETVATLRVNSIAVGDEDAVLQLEEMGAILNRTIPVRTFGDGAAAFPIPGPNLAGTHQPWIIGTPKDCALLLTSSAGGFDFYQYDDILYNAISDAPSAVYAVHRTTRAKTALSTPAQWTHIGSFHQVRVDNSLFPADTYDIWADLSWTAGGTTFGAVAENLLLRLGESAANIDSAAFDAADVLAPAPLGAYFTQAITAADVMRKLEQSARAQVFVGIDGRWTCRVLNPDAPAEWTLTDQDFATLEPDSDLASVLNEVRVEYDYRHATDSAAGASSSDDAVLYARETTDSHRVSTYLRNEADAEELAQHLRFFKGATPHLIRFEERGLTLMSANVGDLVAVTRARAPVARTGAYHGHILRIVHLEKSLGPEAPTVRGVLSDLDGRTDQIARCLDADEDLDWSAATDEQRAIYGFCGDDNRYIDSADPLTRDLKVV
jgi:hypothetical protein